MQARVVAGAAPHEYVAGAVNRPNAKRCRLALEDPVIPPRAVSGNNGRMPSRSDSVVRVLLPQSLGVAPDATTSVYAESPGECPLDK